MGRRSINTTKSGKYMNPTDQARKEARKRELKKNKKQRQMVRAAVLKGKDPLQILADMKNIDEMEYNVVAPPLLNEKVLKDKRKKLKETWDRVMRLYSKEDRERYLELKKLEIEYESHRSELMRYYESVRVAQQVQVDEIPLPSTPNMPSFLTSQIPLPNELDLPPDIYPPPISILKKPSSFFHHETYLEPPSLDPPGVPPGPPPDLSSEEDNEDDEDADGVDYDGKELESKEVEVENPEPEDNKTKSRKIRFADEDAEDEGDNSDDNEKEEKVNETDQNNNDGEEPKENGDEPMDTSVDGESLEKEIVPNPEDIPIPPLNQVPLPAGPPPRLPQGPPPMMFRPPPLRQGMPPPPRLLPPGVPPPPPGRPTLPPPSMPLRLGTVPIRLPPGPPPGVPALRLVRPPPSLPPPRLPAPSTPHVPGQPHIQPPSAVLSAPPSLMQRPKMTAPTEEETQRAATIEAKPQIRNLSADIMRFMPTSLRVKREEKHRRGITRANLSYETSKESYPTTMPVSNPSATAPTKDDAYQQFLLEMEEFL